jgi:hypothetical protein
VQGPDGDILIVIRIDGQTNQSDTQNKAGVLRLDTRAAGRGGRLGWRTTATTLSFVRMIDFPACSSKFVIRRDPLSKLYFTLTTDVTDLAIAQDTVFARNHLVLAVSADLYNWETCTVVLMDDTGLSSLDSAKYTGYHYVDWVFDGADILMAIRTGYRGANSFHNANRLTTLRVSNYSRLVRGRGVPHGSAAAAGLCARSWREDYVLVGVGWCRPTTGFSTAGSGRTAIDCAQICSRMEEGRCQAFAIVGSPGKPSTNSQRLGSTAPDLGACVLYPMVANASGGTDGGNVRCFTKR